MLYTMSDTTERCRKIVTAIAQLDTTELNELYKILQRMGCPHTSNNNGIFVNLSWLPENMLEQIEMYVSFCSESRTEVQRYESICELLVKTPTAEERMGEVRTPILNRLGGAPKPLCEEKKISKVSSSMRFYLLKKKYAKLTPAATIQARDQLEPEPYLINPI
jgi:hypothetical protein